MEHKLEIRKETSGKEQRVFLDGRLDASWAGHLDDYLDGLVREGNYRILLNMSGVQYLSSAGIRILISQYKKIKKIGGLFVLEALSNPVSEVLDMVGMRNMLTEEIPATFETERENSGFLELRHYRFENEVLTDARMKISLSGDPRLSVSAGYTEKDNHKIKFSGNHFGLGIGAIGDGFDDCKNRFGEFLALGDALVYKPSDGSKLPDYAVKSGKLEPEINALYSLQAEGEFSNRLNFEPLTSGQSISLGELAEGFGRASGLEKFVFLIIAESSGLVGVSLNVPPVGGNPLFEFPGIRENINFTTEPAHYRMLTISLGFYANNPDDNMKPFLRQLRPGSTAFIHTHTAVFPFQALSRNEASAGELVTHLFESSIVQDVLHLINDSREIAGIGESSFKQGMAWIGKF